MPAKPRCTRTLSDGTLRMQAKAGTNRLRFEGRVSSSRRLGAGPHSVVIKATAAGKTSPPKSLRFTVVSGIARPVAWIKPLAAPARSSPRGSAARDPESC